MVNDTLFISSVFAAGLLSFFAPCILPLLPVYISHLSTDVSGQEAKRYKALGLTIRPMLLFKTILFVAGLATTFVILGFGAGFLGHFIEGAWFIKAMGVVVILLGIHQTGLLHFNFLEREKKLNLEASRGNSYLSNYLLGLTFSFGWTPCIGPVLGAVLGLSASEGSAFYGGCLMFIYALGLMIPFLVLAFFTDLLLGKVRGLTKHMKTIKIVSGAIIILMGVLLMMDSLTTITVIFEQLLL
jgi:cytochrome c-type biogenesis protein